MRPSPERPIAALRNAAAKPLPPSAEADVPRTDRRQERQSLQLEEVFLEAMSTGIITQEDIDWLTQPQTHFNRDEEATALRLGRLLDEGVIQIGYRWIGFPRPVVDLTA